MLRLKFCLFAGFFFTAIMALAAENSPDHNFLLYVASSRGDDINIIDLNSLKVIGQLKAGLRVHGVCVQADGKRLFATVESDQTLRIIDTESQQTLGTIKVSGRPNQCASTPDGKYVVVPIRDKDVVDIVDIKEQKIVKSLPIKEPHNGFNTGSNRYIYVSAMSGHEVDRIDLEKMEYVSHIPVGGRPRPYVFSPDEKTMYVALSDLHGFAIVDVAGKKDPERVEIPSENKTFLRKLQYETPDTLTHGMALTPDGSELWVSSLLDDATYIYDVKAKKVTGRVNSGPGPNWIVFSPDGKYACVSDNDSDEVSVIDVKSRREAARVKVGKVPKRLAVAIAPVAAAPTAPGKLR